jgi:HAD superfamily hydrolase (TIGR01509 family)
VTESDAAYLPTADTQAILFDCDGTLVDTMAVHREVWDRIFARYGFAITDEWWDIWANVALLPFVREVIPDASPELADGLNDEAMPLYLEALHRIEPLEHVIQVARDFHGTVPLAVVTGGYRDVVVPTLDAAGITGLFDIIVTADDVVRSKPAPDVYVLAMQRLAADPARCVVYEDSEIGMMSARDAGVGRIVDIRDWPTG